MLLYTPALVGVPSRTAPKGVQPWSSELDQKPGPAQSYLVFVEHPVFVVLAADWWRDRCKISPRLVFVV